MSKLAAAAPETPPPSRMERAAASLLGRNYWVLAYASFALGLALPFDLEGSRDAIPPLLCGLMFFTSLRVAAEELSARTRRLRDWLRLGGFVLIKLVLLPLCVFGLLLGFGSEWALGTLLICAMPAGLSSPAFADINGGKVELALLVVLGTSLACPLTVPLLMQAGAAWAGRADSGLGVAAVLERASFIAGLLLLPFFAAQWFRRRVPRWVARNQERFSPAALLFLLLINFSATASTRALWLAQPARELLAPLGAVVFACLLAYLVAYALSYVLPLGDAIAFGSSAVYMNNGLGIAFALTFFGDERAVVVPVIVMVVPIVWLVSWVGRGWRARVPEPARALGAHEQ